MSDCWNLRNTGGGTDCRGGRGALLGKRLFDYGCSHITINICPNSSNHTLKTGDMH